MFNPLREARWAFVVLGGGSGNGVERRARSARRSTAIPFALLRGNGCGCQASARSARSTAIPLPAVRQAGDDQPCNPTGGSSASFSCNLVIGRRTAKIVSAASTKVAIAALR